MLRFLRFEYSNYFKANSQDAKMAVVLPIHINSPDTWSMVLSVGQAR